MLPKYPTVTNDSALTFVGKQTVIYSFDHVVVQQDDDDEDDLDYTVAQGPGKVVE